MVDTCNHDILRQRYTTEVIRQDLTPTKEPDQKKVQVTTNIYQVTMCLLCGEIITKDLITSRVDYEK